MLRVLDTTRLNVIGGAGGGNQAGSTAGGSMRQVRPRVFLVHKTGLLLTLPFTVFLYPLWRIAFPF